ncbi:MAG TPA: LamG-like jellyroll fold domain-containing protein [Anaerolineae bacterium]|nr:LamG-like jellyroll fold domain-containing protein [Anaerolineae bacterium]
MIELAELLLTDGTTTIDLLSLATASGLHLRSWTPASSRYKGRGVWHDSPLASGKRPAFHSWDATEEAMQFTLVGLTTDDLAHRAADFRNLLQQAWDYFENGWPQADPVYLIRRAHGETNPAYSLVMGGETPQDGGYTAEVSAVSYTVGYESWDVRIWREEHWRDCVPGSEGVCLPNAGYESVCRPCFVEFAANGIITVPFGVGIDDLMGAAFTAELWVKFDTMAACQLFDKGLAGPAGWDLAVSAAGAVTATIQFTVADAIQNSNNGVVVVGTWYHIAMTWNPADNRPLIWIDGAQPGYAAGQDKNGATVADGAHDLLIGNNVGLGADLQGDVGWTRASDTERYTVPFTPAVRCDPPAIGVNTMGQWVGEECAGTLIRNMANDPTFDGTLANGTFDCDCLDWVGNIDPADDSIDYTCEEDDIEAFIRNAHGRAAITQIWHFDATAPGTYTGNLVEESNYELLPNPMQVGDFLYIGIDNAAWYYGGFFNVVFDLVDVGANPGGQWTYGTGGAGWGLFAGGSDGTQSFNQTGIRAFSWPIPAAPWVAQAVHGITAYWIRYEVLVAPGNVPPTQQNRPVYTTTWAFTEFESASVPGDVPALARILGVQAGEDQLAGTDEGLMPSRVLLALRSKDRGADFVPYFNFGDPSVAGAAGAQAQVGVTPAVEAQGTEVGDTDRQQAVRVVGSNTIAGTWQPVQSWAIAAAYAPQYYGSYRVFFRGACIAHAGAILRTRVQFAMASGIVATTKEIDWIHDTRDDKLYDLGLMTLPPYAPAHATDLPRTALTITVQQYTDNAGDSMSYYDLAILPVDEKVVEATTTPPGASTLSWQITSRLLFDSTTTLREGSLRTLTLDSGGAVTGYWMPISAGSAWFQVNADQRLWMLGEWYDSANAVWMSAHEMHLRILLKRIARYRSLRGSR